MTDQLLRPVERRVRRQVEDGVGLGEIARRFNRSPAWVDRVLALSELPRSGVTPPDSVLRPIERRVLWWRDEGAGHAEIGSRFHRSGPFIQQVEELARYKLERAPD